MNEVSLVTCGVKPAGASTGGTQRCCDCCFQQHERHWEVMVKGLTSAVRSQAENMVLVGWMSLMTSRSPLCAPLTRQWIGHLLLGRAHGLRDSADGRLVMGMGMGMIMVVWLHTSTEMGQCLYRTSFYDFGHAWLLVSSVGANHWYVLHTQSSTSTTTRAGTEKREKKNALMPIERRTQSP